MTESSFPLKLLLQSALIKIKPFSLGLESSYSLFSRVFDDQPSSRDDGIARFRLVLIR